MLTGHGLERGLDLHVLQGHVSAHFVGHQAAYFVEQLAKAVGAGVPIAHQGQLVLHQWVVNQVQIGTRGGVHGDDRRHGFSLNEISLVLFEHQPSILLTLVLFRELKVPQLSKTKVFSEHEFEYRLQRLGAGESYPLHFDQKLWIR